MPAWAGRLGGEAQVLDLSHHGPLVVAGGQFDDAVEPDMEEMRAWLGRYGVLGMIRDE